MRHRDGAKFEKSFKIENFNFFSFLRHEVPFKAKNNREAVVVCAIHVVKRPSKRSVLVHINRVLMYRFVRGFTYMNLGFLKTNPTSFSKLHTKSHRHISLPLWNTFSSDST